MKSEQKEEKKVHRNIFKSFRFEIVLYSLFSLICTILLEGVVFGVGSFILYTLNKSKEKNTAIYKVTEALNEEKLSGSNLSNSFYDSLENKTLGLGKNMMGILIGAAILLGLVLFITFFLIFTKRFSRYLEEITEGIAKMSCGDFKMRIAIRNDDELTDIAVNLNKMAKEVYTLFENERKSENAKNDLITNVAHDLRTPLTSIIGYLDLVAKKPMEEETKNKYIHIAYDKSKRLEQLIEDLFTYTKLDFGEVKPVCSELDLVKMMEQMYEEFYPSFEENKIQCEFDCRQTSLLIQADGGLLARAFANLISNAIKYGADGKNIVIYVGKEEGFAVVSIKNFGELIPEEALNNIFEKFYRVETSRSTETGGSGLGLTIAKNIIQLHGGSLTARSDFHGTVFEAKLPMTRKAG